MRRKIALWAFWLLPVLLASCSTRHFQVSYLRPAALNLKGSQKIALGGITGKGAAALEPEIFQAIFETGRFSVLSSAQTRKLLQENSLVEASFSSNYPRNNLSALGDATLLLGEITAYDREQVIEEREERDYDLNGLLRVYHVRQRRVWVTIEAWFQLIDCQTGEVVALRLFRSKVEAKSDEARYLPRRVSSSPPAVPYLDERLLFAKAREQIVNELMKLLVPYQDTADVYLYAERKIPALAQGVRFARMGDWVAAKEHFEEALAEHPESDKAMYNLGVAYEYLGEFNKAIPLFRKAYQKKPIAQYQRELVHCKRLREEQKRLKGEL